MPTHLQQMDGKGLARQRAEFLDDRFRLGDARSKPRCRLESCAVARPPSPNRAKLLLGPSEIGQAAGALFSDQGLKSQTDRKSTRLNSSHGYISYAVFCLKKKKQRL